MKRLSFCFLPIGRFLLWSLLGLFVCTGAQASELQENAIDVAVQFYARGRVVDAVESLSRSVDAAVSDDEKINLLMVLLAICVQVQDQTCLNKYHLILLQTSTAKSASITASQRDEWDAKLLPRLSYLESYGFYIGLQRSFLERQTSWLIEQLRTKKLVLSKVFLPVQGRLYVDAQIILARYFLREKMFVEARQSIDKAMSLIVSFKNPSPYFLALWLSEIIEVLHYSADTQRARQLYFVSRDAIVQGFFQRPHDYAVFRLREANLLVQLGNIEGARRSAEEAQLIFASLQLPKHLAEYRQVIATNLILSSCVFINDAACFQKQLAIHPYGILTKEQLFPMLRHSEVAGFYALRLLGDSSFRLQDSTDFTQLPAEMPHGMDQTSWDFIQGLAYIQNGAKGSKFLVAAAELHAATWEATLGQSEDANPQPGTTDRVVFSSGLLAFAQLGLGDREGAAKALPILELLSRTTRTAEADALQQIASQRDEVGRREAHSLLRLSSRQASIERERLQQLIRRISSTSSAPADYTYDYIDRSALSKFGKERLRIQGGSSTTANLVLRKHLPRLDDLQRALKDGEAYVQVFRTLGAFVAHLCVTKDDAILRWSQVDFDRFSRAAKTLEIALDIHTQVATRSQRFPVESGFEIYESLFGPIRSCVDNATHILWRVPEASINVPLAVLPIERPSVSASLRAIRWLGTEKGISYVQSASSILAARTMTARSRPELTFLGIGDPRSGSTGSQQLALRNVVVRPDGKIPDFSELPETRDELLAVSGRLPRPTKTLLGSDATESRFRREPLGRYRSISFATHGLLREEIKGLTEAALLLSTTDRQAGESDDGLLTASEIADLRLGATFVSLSACNTGAYDLQTFSSEVPSLTTAFSLAGVPTVMATLWPVDSNAARDISISMYSNLQDHEPFPAIALKKAFVTYMEKTKEEDLLHPAYWAAFAIFGDGGAFPETISAPVKLVEMIFENNREGGEGISVAADRKSGTRYVAGYSDIEAGRYHSFIGALSKDSLQYDWLMKDRQVTFGTSPIPVADGVIIGGYAFNRQGREFTPMIRKFGSRGAIEWELVLDGDTNSDGMVTSLVATGEGRGVALVVWSSKVGVKRSIQLIEFSSEGVILKKTSTALWDGYGSPRTKMAVSGNRVIFAAHEQGISKTGKPQLDQYDDIELCGYTTTSFLWVADLQTLTVAGGKIMDDLVVNDLQVREDGQVLVAATIRNRCDHNSFAQLFRLEDNGAMRPIWSLQSKFRSDAKSVHIVGDDVILVGEARRSVNFEDVPMPSFDKGEYFQQSYFNRLARSELTDIFVARVGLDGRQHYVDWIQSGGQLSVQSSVLVGSQLTITGSSGSEVMRASLLVQ